ncbi:MAG: leucine--tRNA ligase [Endomicrobium sp.]|uniref:leucine--tRNA ligase n=1 Tax=Candidatus Endomicrobiellum pyrsonymphae TaxID=1408203 RepID=UPI00358AAFF2|nr:leucine--tRNA ligase [Endomicrobium sp.]
MTEYNHSEIEKKWQKRWSDDKIFECKEDSKKEKYYCLEMLPYPSGNLHMGHVRNYSIGDVFARFHKMKGKNVLHPIGWDAFGLPAENAAIKNKIHPAKWTKQNIARMREQLKVLGFSYDWSREITTCDPEYYRWNQWFFIKMWERGLVFRKRANVNWCPSCQTVLASEQVSNGMCWRCDSHTERRDLEQWFIKITDYVDELLDGHKQLSDWSEQVLSMQKNWIGKSFGVEIDFALAGAKKKLKVFTTRPDTLFGATFIVVAPEHEIINEMKLQIINYNEVAKYAIDSGRKSNIERSSSKEKTGIKLEGINAINPSTGKEIPVFTADYVLIDYGTGAIMAVPAHDQRDWEFAKKYNAPIIEVIKGNSSTSVEQHAYEDEGLLVNSGQFDGVKSTEAFDIVAQWVEKQGFGKKIINFKLKDWLISRQRYWGTPIPMIYCEKCGIVVAPEKDLPILLPEDVEFTGEGGSPLKSSKIFVNVKCPKCGADARRETDTMDTFIDSSWYYVRYCDARNDATAFDSAKLDYWMPVNQYVGGIEHACMHLIYSRFWYKVMRDLGLTKHDEPFINLLTQGMVTLGGSAMSKSRGNVVSPDEIIEKYGADTARLFILFAAPPQKQLDWSSDGVKGCWRFINRVWHLFDVVNTKSNIVATEKDKADILRITHQTIKKVTYDIEKEFQLNTAISSVMELVTALYTYKYHSNDNGISLEAYKAVILLMSPFTPHLCEEIWEKLGHEECISTYTWPTFDENMTKESSVELPVQINGKLKGKIIVAMDVVEGEVKKIIEADNKIAAQLKDKQIVKFMYVKNKIVTIVVK